MVLLLVLGALENLEAGRLQACRREPAGPDPPPAEPPQRLRVSLRERRISQRAGRTSLPEGVGGGELAQSVDLLRRRPNDPRHWNHRREDARTVRIRGSQLLARRSAA